MTLYWYCKEKFCLGHSWEFSFVSSMIHEQNFTKKSSYSWKALDQQGIWKNTAIWNRMIWMPNWCFLFGIFCRWSSSPKGKQKTIISVVFIKSCVNVGTPFVWQNKKWQLFSKVQIKKRHNFIFLLVFGRWHKTVCVIN